ncbi:MAG: hypothetical protein WD712_00535 [Candidatus Spechtbacterales bacterium]
MEDHAEGCDASHWHSNSRVFGLQNKTSTTIVNSDDPGGCGFGKIAEVPVEFVDLTLEQSAALIANVTP